MLFPVAAVLAAISLALNAAPLSASEPGERPYSVQMHLHAHSNHNGSTHPASLQWHTAQARQYGLDLIWWSEHTGLFDMTDTISIVPATGHFLEDGVSIGYPVEIDPTRPGRTQRAISRLQATRTGEGATACLSEGYLYGGAGVDRFSGRPFSISWTPMSELDLIHQVRWTRSTAGGLIVEADIDLLRCGPGLQPFFEFTLSWHYYEKPAPYVVRINLKPGPGGQTLSHLSADTVVVDQAVPEERSRIAIDLSAIASNLPDGDDATLQGFRWGLEGTAEEGAAFGVKRIDIFTTRQRPETYIPAVRSILDRYENEYGVGGEIGGEFAFDRVHLNAFYPDSSFHPRLFRRNAKGNDAAAWVSSMRAKGAVVSYNHPFGTKMDSMHDNDAPGARSSVISTGLGLLMCDAYGADILEVGYLRRVLDLRGHLSLWDFLTAHELFLYGNGTSDSHGGIWFEGAGGNWYTTWVWAKDRLPESLLAGMRKGRMYFGDISRWDGRFEFRIGPYRAGDRVPLPGPETPIDLKVLLDPLPDSPIVYLVHGLIDRSSRKVRYLEQRTRIDIARPPALMIDEPCFIRLEVYRRTGDQDGEAPLLFSNPILFLDRPTDHAP